MNKNIFYYPTFGEFSDYVELKARLSLAKTKYKMNKEHKIKEQDNNKRHRQSLRRAQVQKIKQQENKQHESNNKNMPVGIDNGNFRSNGFRAGLCEREYQKS
ncbi:MAG: hypothetical protein LBT27_08100 [Prevotellaceae bacterium]|nr:hypothetical protein [Prevotellaceae bacterium]